jgi:hypothetical protein
MNKCSLSIVFNDQIRYPVLDRERSSARTAAEDGPVVLERYMVDRADEQRQQVVEVRVVDQRLLLRWVHRMSPCPHLGSGCWSGGRAQPSQG